MQLCSLLLLMLTAVAQVSGYQMVANLVSNENTGNALIARLRRYEDQGLTSAISITVGSELLSYAAGKMLRNE